MCPVRASNQSNHPPAHPLTDPPASWLCAPPGMKSKTVQRMEALRKAREEAEVAECTFKPTISRRSDKLMAARGETLRALNVSAHHQLFQESLRRQQRWAWSWGKAGRAKQWPGAAATRPRLRPAAWTAQGRRRGRQQRRVGERRSRPGAHATPSRPAAAATQAAGVPAVVPGGRDVCAQAHPGGQHQGPQVAPA